MPDPVPLSAEYFDGWYADMAVSTAKDEIQQRHLGLPRHLLATSTLPWSGLDDVVAALRLQPGDVVLDLACGRGSYGLEIARRTGARLVGVDFSAEAIEQARARAAGIGAAAEFRVGDLVATGCDRASIDAVLCVDSVQFASPQDAAYAEMLRVLVPGGRALLTCWEPLQPDDERLPSRIRSVALGAGLARAGFTDVVVAERPDWRDVERAMLQEAAGLSPGDDRSLQSFHAEAIRSLATFDLLRRVVATATAPA
jgi:SAM-dependent methyltransferase